MSSSETGSQAAPPASLPALRRLDFWIKELPFALMLILTTLGVTYTTFSKQPIFGFWELLALICVGSGWPSAADRTARLTLIGLTLHR
jgi:hypothetical protein